jgi:hypothetical protein
MSSAAERDDDVTPAVAVARRTADEARRRAPDIRRPVRQPWDRGAHRAAPPEARRAGGEGGARSS